MWVVETVVVDHRITMKTCADDDDDDDNVVKSTLFEHKIKMIRLVLAGLTRVISVCRLRGLSFLLLLLLLLDVVVVVGECCLAVVARLLLLWSSSSLLHELVLEMACYISRRMLLRYR